MKYESHHGCDIDVASLGLHFAIGMDVSLCFSMSTTSQNVCWKGGSTTRALRWFLAGARLPRWWTVPPSVWGQAEGMSLWPFDSEGAYQIRWEVTVWLGRSVSSDHRCVITIMAWCGRHTVRWSRIWWKQLHTGSSYDLDRWSEIPQSA
jgi:hypothetical protein